MPPLCWQKDKPVVGFTPAVLMEGRYYRTPSQAADAWIERRFAWRMGGFSHWPKPKTRVPVYYVLKSREHLRFRRRVIAHFAAKIGKLNAAMYNILTDEQVERIMRDKFPNHPLRSA